ncbi:hypothetical protein EWB00_000829 [Schistosoma japonicum]|uniref:Uncharacterized protein n=1 Tax=Schistosoma japonicum TaxID=6182 RepID=A0A4Z2CK25_SCHJA|nr:hypothetical protein EWB00_000829 [Schistosoma japonicum]
MCLGPKPPGYVAMWRAVLSEPCGKQWLAERRDMNGDNKGTLASSSFGFMSTSLSACGHAKLALRLSGTL